MLKLYSIALIYLVCLVSFPVFGQDVTSKIDSLYQVPENAPGFSIAVFQGDNIIMEKQYGLANLDYNVPIHPETVFDIGSIAKQFTALAVMFLEEAGKISIKDPAYTYLENLPRYPKGDPTIEQLLNQTSGIREVDLIAGIADLNRQDLLTQSQMVNFISKVGTLNFAPGDYFQYTNSNYILLAEIVAQVSGMSFAEYLKQAVFEPFRMHNTLKKESTYSIVKDRAIGYQEDEGTYYKTHLHSFIYDGDGQVLTTARDIFQWHMGLRKLQSENPELYQKMHRRAHLNNGSEIDFGLGVEFESHNGHEGYGFDGMIKGGFVSKYLYFPELDLAFFTTQNTFDLDFDERFFQLVDLYVSSKNEDEISDDGQNENKEDGVATDLKSYEGTYLFLGSDDEDLKRNQMRVIENELVVLTLDGEEITRLKPLGQHRFLFHDKLVEFDMAATGKSYKYYNDANEMPWVFKEFRPESYTKTELAQFEGQYFNPELQISKKIELHNDTLFFYYRNGAYKEAMTPLLADVFDISFKPVNFVRDREGHVVGLKIMDILFTKL